MDKKTKKIAKETARKLETDVGCAVVDDLDADPSFVDEVVKHLGYDEQNRIEEREESRRPDVHKRHWMTDASH